MRVIARSTLLSYAKSMSGDKRQPALKAALDAWFSEIKHAVWKTSADVKRSYAHASIIGKDRVVFNIKGNDFRLITSVDYSRCIVFIKWIGTHMQYDKIDVEKVEYDRKAHSK